MKLCAAILNKQNTAILDKPGDQALNARFSTQVHVNLTKIPDLSTGIHYIARPLNHS